MTSQFLASLASNLYPAHPVEIGNLCDPDLVEENFGDLIRSAIPARFGELLNTAGIEESRLAQSPPSSYSALPVKEQSTKKCE